MRGIGFFLADCVVAVDCSVRGKGIGPGMIVPASRRAIFGAQIMADPKLLEPVLLVE
eukprot:CAMPEP_0185850376 /NCGR_PEP_ID=MMETSP1354-20130828/4535_1 /TAXON_ID=708628 /ORGANISM="Erythrolobus madagascarensis, Strain CCMP3276" /LENGTH=56 /DNA_ID=CAMNT_0028551045 /DNA_START=69 /DNA_END=236 /DNA_ORIENTATION=-